jgi:hypothetical protein
MEELKIISWSDAKAAKLTRYFTGEPCKRAHISELFVRDRTCLSCASERKRTERALDPEKRRLHDRAHRNPEKDRAKCRAQRAADPEKARARVRASKAKKLSAEVSATVDRGLMAAKASGRLLDLDVAMNLFKTQDNAFEFLE